jgi:hypothetical protein
MSYEAEVAVYSQINAKQMQRKQNVKFLNVKPVGASRNKQALKG